MTASTSPTSRRTRSRSCRPTASRIACRSRCESTATACCHSTRCAPARIRTATRSSWSFVDGGAPLHGDVTFDPGLAYVPKPGYVGPDRIRYRVIDSVAERRTSDGEHRRRRSCAAATPPPPRRRRSRIGPRLTTPPRSRRTAAGERPEARLKLTLRSSELTWPASARRRPGGRARLGLRAGRAARRYGKRLQTTVAAGTMALTVARRRRRGGRCARCAASGSASSAW